MKSLPEIIRENKKLSIEQLRDLVRADDDAEEKKKEYREELMKMERALTTLQPFNRHNPSAYSIRENGF
jgi:hypothetical protein